MSVDVNEGRGSLARTAPRGEGLRSSPWKSLKRPATGDDDSVMDEGDQGWSVDDEPGAVFVPRPGGGSTGRPFDENTDLLPPRTLLPFMRRLGPRERRLVWWSILSTGLVALYVVGYFMVDVFATAFTDSGDPDIDLFEVLVLAPVFAVTIPFCWPFWIGPALLVGAVVAAAQGAGIRGPVAK